MYVLPAPEPSSTRASVLVCRFCTLYAGRDLHLILGLFLIQAWFCCWAGLFDPALVSECVSERNGMGWLRCQIVVSGDTLLGTVPLFCLCLSPPH